jgi:hypothetical protein
VEIAWPIPRSVPGQRRAVILLRRLLLLVTAWHLADSVISVVTGVIARSPAVIVFGVCSFTLLLGSLAVLWRFAPVRAGRPGVEEAAERVVGLSFYAVSALAAAGAAWALVVEHAPGANPVDVALAALTLGAMPPVGLTIMRLGEAVESNAARAEGYQTVLYGLLAGALLIGLGGNAVGGLWWANSIAALAIAAFAWRAGRRLRHDLPVSGDERLSVSPCW